MLKINKIAEKLDIKEEDLEYYGWYKAKLNNTINEKVKNNKDGHLISAPIGDTGNQAFIEALKRRKKMLTN